MKNIIKVILILGVCAFSACQQGTSTRLDAEMATTNANSKQTDNKSMDHETAERNRKIVEDAFDDWVTGKGSFFDLLDENMVWHVTGKAPFSGVYQGKKDFMEKAVVPINNFLSTSIKPELIDINASGDIVWLQWKGAATAVAGGQYINEYAWKLKFDNGGKIIAVEAFLDTYTLGKLVEK